MNTGTCHNVFIGYLHDSLLSAVTASL
jgi:hypothetical protein